MSLALGDNTFTQFKPFKVLLNHERRFQNPAKMNEWQLSSHRLEKEYSLKSRATCAMILSMCVYIWELTRQ